MNSDTIRHNTLDTAVDIGTSFHKMVGKPINIIQSPRGTGSLSSSWQPEDIFNADEYRDLYIEVEIDKWIVSPEYPFKITRLTEERLNENHPKIIDITQHMPGSMYMLDRLYKNSTYGVYAGISGASSLQQQYYGRLFRHNFGKEFNNKILTNHYHNELLINHYTHKVGKMAKKKKDEIETLNKIIKKLNIQNDDYVDEYPEVFV